MALSGSWTFSVNRDDIIREAMLNVGAIGEAETPTAQEVTDCARKLNMLVKQWMQSQDFAPGLKMWERQRGDLFLTSAQGVYELGTNSSDHWAGSTSGALPGNASNLTQLIAPINPGDNSFFVASTARMNVGDTVGIFIGPDIFWTQITAVSIGSGNIQIPGPGLPAAAASGNSVYSYTRQAQRPLGIVTATLRDQYGNDTPLSVMTLEEYESLPSKMQPGFITDPSAFYYESQFSQQGSSNISGGGWLFLDMFGAQDTNKYIHIVYIRSIMDFTQPNDNPEYPQQWYRALCWGLAREIAPMFDAEWTQEMQINYSEALAMARESDSEKTTMYFQPNAFNEYGL